MYRIYGRARVVGASDIWGRYTESFKGWLSKK